MVVNKNNLGLVYQYTILLIVLLTFIGCKRVKQQYNEALYFESYFIDYVTNEKDTVSIFYEVSNDSLFFSNVSIDNISKYRVCIAVLNNKKDFRIVNPFKTKGKLPYFSSSRVKKIDENVYQVNIYFTRPSANHEGFILLREISFFIENGSKISKYSQKTYNNKFNEFYQALW